MNKNSKYNYTLLRITIIALALLSALLINNSFKNNGNYKRGQFVGTYQEYYTNYGRAPDFTNDNYSQKVLFFTAKPGSTVEELQKTQILNANFKVADVIPSNLALIKVEMGSSDLEAKYQVTEPNVFVLLDNKGVAVKRSTTIAMMPDLANFIK
jgi:hypothetical protein